MGSKKRKVQQQQQQEEAGEAAGAQDLTAEDVRKLLEPFTKEDLVEVVQKAVVRHGEVLDDVRKAADRNPACRKLFVRALSYDTTSQTVKQVFSQYGDIKEAVVVTDKSSGKSRGYAFVTFQHADSAIRALREPNKKIDGRITVAHLSSTGPPPERHGQSGRKIYVSGIPSQIDSERLLNVFSKFGEIEEGPLGLHKSTNKGKRFAIFLYKTVEGAKCALEQPIKSVDGSQLHCSIYTGDTAKPKGEGVDTVDFALQQAGSAAGAASVMYQNALGASQVLGPVLLPGIGLGASLAPPYASLSLASGLGAYPSVLGTPQSVYGSDLGSLYSVPTAVQPIFRGSATALEGSQVVRAAGARLP